MEIYRSTEECQDNLIHPMRALSLSLSPFYPFLFHMYIHLHLNRQRGSHTRQWGVSSSLNPDIKFFAFVATVFAGVLLL